MKTREEKKAKKEKSATPPKKAKSIRRQRPFRKPGNRGACYETARGAQLREVKKVIMAHGKGYPKEEQPPLVDLANALAGVVLAGPWSVRVKMVR